MITVFIQKQRIGWLTAAAPTLSIATARLVTGRNGAAQAPMPTWPRVIPCPPRWATRRMWFGKPRPAPATPPWSFRAICSPSQRNRATPRCCACWTNAPGEELWKTAYGQTYPDDGFGAGPRCAPLFDGDLIYVQTCRGELSCLRVKDGSQVWGTDYQKNFRSQMDRQQGTKRGSRLPPRLQRNSDRRR